MQKIWAIRIYFVTLQTGKHSRKQISKKQGPSLYQLYIKPIPSLYQLYGNSQVTLGNLQCVSAVLFSFLKVSLWVRLYAQIEV